MKCTCLTIVFVAGLFIQTNAQTPVIWTVEGEKIECIEIENYKDPSATEIKFINSKNRADLIDRHEVFSITERDSTQYIYSPLFEDDRTLEQMKLYINGQRLGYSINSRDALIIGFASGLLSMSLPPDKLFMAPLFPFVTTICIGKISPTKMPDINDEHFRDGFKQRRKKKNIKSSVIGGVAGVVVGVFGSFLIYGWGL
ncbi:MAG: hypothetical protein PHU27_12535 [Salinivirgaceae bacterium]|nr:hypothetical protein [Salinivirgaceae bacterium]MDD4746078.1 hypothetical protein [Salinivirgaceae bacterium]